MLDWTQIAVATLGMIGVIGAPTAAALAVRRSERRTAAHLDRVHEQVSNDHSTNLRDDIDAIATLVRESDANRRRDHRDLTRRVDRVSRDIGAVKDDQRALRERLDNHIDGR